MMTPSMLESMLWAAGNEFEPQEATEKLASFANQRGGMDNISILIVRRRDRSVFRTLFWDKTNDDRN